MKNKLSQAAAKNTQVNSHVATHSTALEVENSALGKRWIPTPYNERHALGISQTYNLPEIVGRMLSAREIGFDDVKNFLNPTLKVQLPNPSILKDMDKAAGRLSKAVINDEKIAVFGDYDVDGATSTALLRRFFGAVGIDLRVYIPDRMKEGYGPNTEALLKLKEEGASVVMTVDCGISAHEPLAAATEAGLDMIVLDHHEAEPNLPDAFAVVNPNRLDEDRSLGNLAAVGVAFLAIVAVNRELRKAGFYNNRAEPRLTQWLDIVALGTVCDVVPLTGINRAFVAQGLKVMSLRQNKGIKALADIAGVNEAPTAFHAGFMLGPRVNAGGRVGESYLGSKLLSTEDVQESHNLAAKLHQYNKDRRDIEALVLEQAIEQVEAQQEIGNILMVAGDNWHPGVIGIVASRLKEKYNRPSCVIGFDDQGVGKASGRSIPGIDLGSLIIAARQNELLLNGGGHKMAAGFTVTKDKYEEVCAFLNERIEQQLNGQPIVSQLRIDGILSPLSLNLNMVYKIDQLAPFGAGNSEPRFALMDCRIAKASVVGEDHVKCFIQDSSGGRSINGIAFRALNTPLGELLMKGGDKPLHLAGYVRINRWNGYESVQFQIVDAASIWDK